MEPRKEYNIPYKEGIKGNYLKDEFLTSEDISKINTKVFSMTKFKESLIAFVIILGIYTLISYLCMKDISKYNVLYDSNIQIFTTIGCVFLVLGLALVREYPYNLLPKNELLKNELNHKVTERTGNPKSFPYTEISKYTGKIQETDIKYEIKTNVVRTGSNPNQNVIFMTKYVSSSLTFKSSELVANRIDYMIREGEQVIHKGIDITGYLKNISFDDLGYAKIEGEKAAYVREKRRYSYFILSQYRRLELIADWILSL